MINWKLIIIVTIIILLSFIIIIYKIPEESIKIDYFNVLKNRIMEEKESVKIKTDITEDQFKDLECKEDFVYYYFPSTCPSYKDEKFIKMIENNLEKFFVPEEKHIIVVKKEHEWTKEPIGILFWKHCYDSSKKL